MSWYLSLPPAQALVPCGTGTHAVRWEAGRLSLPAHPDPRAELVLAALGGDKPRCIEVTETWAGHAEDLDVLMTGPRSREDQVRVDWDEAEEHRASWLGMLASPAPRGPGRVSAPGGGSGLRPGPGQGARPGRIRPGHASQELMRRVQARIEVLHLLALGPAFQFRLAGTVTAAWASRGDAATRQPEVVAALSGRLAPAVAEWLDTDPGLVTATPLGMSQSWGTLTVTGSGAGRRVRASLPVGWLASVWACGMAVVAGHLVVAVVEPGWPHARVRALPEPGAPPVTLDITGTDDPVLPRWKTRS